MAFVLKAGRPLQQKGAGIWLKQSWVTTAQEPLFMLEKDPYLIAAMEKTQLHLQKPLVQLHAPRTIFPPFECL